MENLRRFIRSYLEKQAAGTGKGFVNFAKSLGKAVGTTLGVAAGLYGIGHGIEAIQKYRAKKVGYEKFMSKYPEFKELPKGKKEIIKEVFELTADVAPGLAKYPSAMMPVVKKALEFSDVGITPDILNTLAKAETERLRGHSFGHMFKQMPLAVGPKIEVD